MGPEALGSALYAMARSRVNDESLGEGPRAYLVEQVEAAAKQTWTEEALRGACYGLFAWHGAAKDRLLSALTQVVASDQSGLSEKGVSMCLYGIHNCDGGPASRALLMALVPRVAACSEDLSSMSIGNAIFGLKGFVDSQEARSMLAVLVPKVAQSQEQIQSQHIGIAFMGLVKRGGGSGNSRETLDMLGVLAARFGQCTEPFRAVTLARILNSLQVFNDVPEVHAALDVMPQKIAECNEPFMQNHIGMAFFGLQRLGNPAVMQVIAALTPKIADVREPFSAHTLSNICFGLRRCYDRAEIRALLRLVAPKIVDSRPGYDSKDISCLLNGLQRCGNSQESRDILAALAPKIEEVREVNAQTVGNALYGLRLFRDCPEVRGIFRAFAVKIETMSEPLPGNTVANAIYGFQRCSDSPELQELLLAFSKRMTDRMTQQHIAMTLYGLLSSGQSAASLAVLAKLTDKIAQCTEEFNDQTIGNSLYGLQNFNSAPEVRAVIAALRPHIARGGSAPLGEQAIANSVSGLSHMIDCDEAHAVLGALAPRIASFPGQLSWKAFVFAMRSLKHCRSDGPEHRAVVAALVSKAPAAEPLESIAACDALLGVRFAGDCKETRAALALLVPHLANGVADFDPQRLRRTLAGVSCAPASDEAYRGLLILAPRLQMLAGDLDPVCFEQVACILQGRAARPETSQLLTAIEPHVIRRHAGTSQQQNTKRLREALGAIQGEEAASILRGLDAADAPAAAGAGSAKRPDASLPAGWSQHVHEGKTYYHHAELGSRWERPIAAADVAAPPLPAGWAEHIAPGGRPYYFHKTHGSVWERPKQ